MDEAVADAAPDQMTDLSRGGGANTALLACLAGGWALLMAAGTAWSLVHILRSMPQLRVSSVALFLLLLASLGAVGLAGLAVHWRRRRSAAAVIGVLDNSTAALVCLPAVVLSIAGALLGQSEPWPDRIQDAGVVAFIAVMVLAWPTLGAWLSLGQRSWQVGLGNVLGGIFLLAGWGVYIVLWIAALAGFAA